MKILYLGYFLIAIAFSGQSFADGSIAIDQANDKYGISWNWNTPQEAQSSAIQQCATKQCKIFFNFKNSCAAAVENDIGGWGWASANTIDDAVREATRNCLAETGKACFVRMSQCDGNPVIPKPQNIETKKSKKSSLTPSAMDMKFKRLTNAYKLGNVPEACKLSSQILDELPATQEFAEARQLVEGVEGETCYKVMHQLLNNNPQCQNYQKSKVRCAAAADYSTCMSRLGASVNDYALVCGDL